MDSIDRVLEFRRKMNELKQSPVKAGGYVSPLEGENMLAKGEKLVPEAKKVIGNATDVIDTKTPMKTITGNAFKDKIQSILNARNASKLAKGAEDVASIGKKGLKSIPLLGPMLAGGLTYMATGDANASLNEASPLLNEANPLGPQVGSIEQKLESGEPLTDEERIILSRRK
jgi:hypothetical protein